MITYSHDMTLFIASVVVSFVAAFTGLALTNNISRLPSPQRKALIVMSAFILGGGIWSMHFVAMLAVKIDQPIYYDLLQTLGSALVAILVAGLALLILHFSSRTPQLLTLAGIILGLGIVAMHFIGMRGMRGLTPEFSTTIVALTVLVAMVTGVAAIWAAYGHRSRQNIIAGAAVFGSAVVAVHFTAMHGTRFFPGPPPASQSVFIGDGTLAVTVTITAFIICGAFLLAATTFVSRPDAQTATDPVAATAEAAGATTADTSAAAIVTAPESAPAAGSPASAKTLPVAAMNDDGGPAEPPQTTKSGIATQGISEDILPTKIPFERNKKIHFVPSTEVGAIRADGRYTHLYTESGTLFCPWSITEAEKRLADAGFFRTHRSYLVNLDQLSGFEKSRDAGVCLFENLQQLSTVPVSRKRVPELVAVLGI
jgi:NO-binding membrane sensor protein with MHYT domain